MLGKNREVNVHTVIDAQLGAVFHHINDWQKTVGELKRDCNIIYRKPHTLDIINGIIMLIKDVQAAYKW